MARKTSNLMVGLFTTIGIVLGVIAIIWVGATKYFEKGTRYVTYFDESVQGLQKDSPVKYRGVEVGRVESIRLAPDSNLIAVVMKINLKEDMAKTAVAQLKVAGITGLVYVDLDRKNPKEPDQSPKVRFPSEYPVIASRPSEIKRIMSGVNQVVEKFNTVDTGGAVSEIKSAASEIQIFLKGKDLQAILNNLKATTSNLKDMTGRLDKTVADGKVDNILQEAVDSVKAARILLNNTGTQINDLHLAETMSKARSIINEVGTTTENLRRISESLDNFVRRINERPSDLLFGKPPKGRWNESSEASSCK